MSRSLSKPSDFTGGIELEKIIASNRTKPLVIFIEGTTSNGKGLLPFVSNVPISALPANTDIYPSVLKYTPPDPSTTPIPGSLPGWVIKVLSTQMTITARIKFANKLSTNPQNNEAAFANEIADSITRVGRIRKLGPAVDLAAKREFLSAWYRGRSS
ncbi:hypothetical protein AWJ20_2245 [Sugiyamaella lignohabitans]|uniref:Uncharacterized protein n=1 Tax=Sugiyamaella lignohabitans TaxID=796027 RepID=A0A161HG45_9ASCO|nr:uncharacterized protein AWJ20_2245 [Sugiyamaella lignohabitans]ANB14640.1 hypothetical protein AWJ20_2245 [Sugiyamaella lignohabitans]